MDYQQIYNMDSPVGQRHKERDAAIAAQEQADPKIYDPLTIKEYQQIPLDISVLNLCLDWPIHRPPYTPGLPIPKNAKFTKAPVLVINGELDMLTTRRRAISSRRNTRTRNISSSPTVSMSMLWKTLTTARRKSFGILSLRSILETRPVPPM
ncbi:MAG: hypothetical protein WDM89_07380 [Rhizomicrobium sp.]